MAGTTVLQHIVKEYQDSKGQDSILTITGEMVANTWADIEYCLHTLPDINGAHVKVY